MAQRLALHLGQCFTNGSIFGESYVNSMIIFHFSHTFSNVFLIKIHACCYSYGPSAILLVTNVRLIFKMRHRPVKIALEKESSRRRQDSFNRTVILITVLFVTMTLPNAILTNFFAFFLEKSFFPHASNNRRFVGLVSCLRTHNPLQIQSKIRRKTSRSSKARVHN